MNDGKPFMVLVISNFAELCTTARADNPGPTVDQFFSFHETLVEARVVADALAETRFLGNSENNENAGEKQSMARTVSEERDRSADSWVSAAIGSGLMPYPLNNGQIIPLVVMRMAGSRNEPPG